LHVEVGDVVDLVVGDKREEVRVLGLEPDRDPARVRLRIAVSVLVAPGVEVWPSQNTSRVVARRRPHAAGDAAAGDGAAGIGPDGDAALHEPSGRGRASEAAAAKRGG
jgi:hypothetical protein